MAGHDPTIRRHACAGGSAGSCRANRFTIGRPPEPPVSRI